MFLEVLDHAKLYEVTSTGNKAKTYDWCLHSRVWIGIYSISTGIYLNSLLTAVVKLFDGLAHLLTTFLQTESPEESSQRIAEVHEFSSVENSITGVSATHGLIVALGPSKFCQVIRIDTPLLSATPSTGRDKEPHKVYGICVKGDQIEYLTYFYGAQRQVVSLWIMYHLKVPTSAGYRCMDGAKMSQHGKGRKLPFLTGQSGGMNSNLVHGYIIAISTWRRRPPPTTIPSQLLNQP
ncbi:hypothetical protein BU15DRAFT_65601 [Melanogaster broomeanus]|nr:hypothetical protein BU15DRAFT_65601 [Melanogaster broomeanus]